MSAGQAGVVDASLSQPPPGIFREEEEPPGQVLGHSAACICGVKCDFGSSAPGPGPEAQQL